MKLVIPTNIENISKTVTSVYSHPGTKFEKYDDFHYCLDEEFSEYELALDNFNKSFGSADKIALCAVRVAKNKSSGQYEILKNIYGPANTKLSVMYVLGVVE